jgi:hypothetical protein
MGVSVGVHWPGCTDEQEFGCYGFQNDDRPWAEWLGAAMTNQKVQQSLKAIGASALLSHTTEGMKPRDIAWTTPDELDAAAQRLLEAIAAKDPRVTLMLRLYERGAIGENSPEVEFSQDLNDVKLCAKYARENGAERVVLSYYF